MDCIFILADKALLSSEIFASIEVILRERSVSFDVFSDIEPDPSDTTVTAAFERSQAMSAQALIALGGGSTIDVAKAVAILSTNGGRIHDYEGIEKYSVRPIPLIAIPTTAGTGSEVSGSCVITDTTRHLKMSIRHATLNPATVAILDPLALKTLPPHVAMHAGMDAFVHAFESYISLDANLFTDALNLRALELISGNIRQFVDQRTDTEAATNMLVGSALAGMAFGITGLGNVHCLARFVGAYFHVSHGLSNAICLRHVAEFNRIAAPEKYAHIAAALGEDIRGLSTQTAAKNAVGAIDNLCADLRVPTRLRDIGAREDVYEEIADLCFEANYNRWNPRHTTREDFLRMLHDAH